MNTSRKSIARKFMRHSTSSFYHYRWRIERKLKSLSRKILFLVRVFKSPPEFRARQGKRFLELYHLLKDFLISRIKNNPKHGDYVASQLLNVLKNCDTITYEDEGTAEAYALIHFLDRYHRFQIIFEVLDSMNLMPKKSTRVDILDVGTGPGPSMYAISDYYTSNLDKTDFRNPFKENDIFSVNYVERSGEFRNWLHHFTEYVNSSCPSGIPWMVPYHHGTFQDFQGLEFDQLSTFYDEDIEGRVILRRRLEKYRFDIIVFSNFLTTKEQVESYANELKKCVRFLRNNGILIVVGAKGNNDKYRKVYEEISKAILSENYNSHKFIATCEKIDVSNSNMSYKWNDCYGETLKGLFRDVYALLHSKNKHAIPPEMVKKFNETLQPSYARSIEWEVHVFRKKARMRLHRKSLSN